MVNRAVDERLQHVLVPDHGAVLDARHEAHLEPHAHLGALLRRAAFTRWTENKTKLQNSDLHFSAKDIWSSKKQGLKGSRNVNMDIHAAYLTATSAQESHVDNMACCDCDPLIVVALLVVQLAQKQQ